MHAPTSSARVVAALAGVDFRTNPQAGQGHPASGLTVTLSRDVGCLGEALAARLAQRLGVCCYDRELLDAVVRKAHTERYLMERLDERCSNPMDDFVHTLFSGQSASKEDYRYCLAHTILGIAEHGGVIVGRGAHLVLTRHPVFRVRVTGSLEVCAHRIAEERKLALEDARKVVEVGNRERAEAIHKLFRRDINDLSTYDLGLNTDHLNVEQVKDLVLHAMTLAGFTLPPARTAAGEVKEEEPAAPAAHPPHRE